MLRGHPIGVRASAAWEECSALPLPNNSDSIKCNRATCVVICKPGFQILGQARIRCRQSADGFSWAQDPAPCGTCKGRPSVTGVTIKCRTNKRTNKKVCSMRCPADEVFPQLGLGIRGNPKPAKATCKCDKKAQRCKYKLGGAIRKLELSQLSCSKLSNPDFTPNPITKPITKPTTKPTRTPKTTLKSTNPPNSTKRPTNPPTTKSTNPLTTRPTPVHEGSELSCQSAISSIPVRGAICRAIADANNKRRIHHAPPMEVDMTLCQHAQSYAQLLATRDTGLQHDGNLLNRLQEGKF